jgi:hypothetical protein
MRGLGRDDIVFTSPRGEPIRSRNFRRARVWLPATEALGLSGVTVHELRHACVAALISPGVGPKQIQAQIAQGRPTTGTRSRAARRPGGPWRRRLLLHPYGTGWIGRPAGSGSELVAADLRECQWR